MCGVKMNETAHMLSRDWTFTAPAKLDYGAGRTIDTAGMSYTATCSVCGELDLTDLLTIDPAVTPETDEDGKVTVTAYYGEESVGSFEVTIVRYEIFSNWNGWGPFRPERILPDSSSIRTMPQVLRKKWDTNSANGVRLPSVQRTSMLELPCIFTSCPKHQARLSFPPAFRLSPTRK